MAKDLTLEDVAKTVGEVKQIFHEFKEAAAEREKEVMTKGDVDVILEEKLNKINEELDKKQEQLDLFAARQKKQTIFVDGKETDIADLDKKALAWAAPLAQRRNKTLTEYSHEDLQEYKAAFDAYLRTKDEKLLTGDEIKALSVGSDPDGGYVVDPDTSGRMVKKIYETSPMRQYANLQVISTDALEGLLDQDEAASGWVSETGARTETATPQIGIWRIPVHEQYAEPRATQKLLDDASINMEEWLANKVAEKMARTENTAFVDGDGNGKPRGFLTYPDGTADNGQIERIQTGVNGDFAADPAGGDVLIDTIHKLKDAYRGGAAFYMNRLTLGAVRLLKDSNGRMLWQPSLAAGMPSTLLGHEVRGMEDMPDYSTTGALAIAYGNMAECYQIVERMGTRVLRDPYTAKPFVKFYTTRRVGGDVINFESLKLIEFSA